MLLQKRRQFERSRLVHQPEQREPRRDPLFERDWEIFIVKRDPETGEFLTETVVAASAESAENN